jgi:hypothetical protein
MGDRRFGISPALLALGALAIGTDALGESRSWHDVRDARHDSKAEACELDAELGARADGAALFLKFSLLNRSPRPETIDTLLIDVKFEGGEARVHDTDAPDRKIELKPGVRVEREIPLSDATTASQASVLDVSVPVLNAQGDSICRLNRTLGLGPPPGPTEKTEAAAAVEPSRAPREGSRFDLELDFGWPLARAANLKALGGSGPAFGLGFTYLPLANTGISLNVGVEALTGSVSGQSLASLAGGSFNGNQPQLVEGFLSLALTQRIPISRALSFRYELGPGVYFFNLDGSSYSGACYYGATGCSSSSQDFSGSIHWMVYQKAALDFRPDGWGSKDRSHGFGLGLALYDAWMPSASWSLLPVSGSSLGLVAFALLGWQ